MRVEDWKVRLTRWPSPLFSQADELRFRALHEPFGVARDDAWQNDDPGSRHAFALAGDAVVGYARLILEPGGTVGQIRQVSVDPAWERRGIGSAMMRSLMTEAESLRLRRVWLNARVPAIPFYERLGFSASGEVFRTPRTYLPHRRMDLDV